MSLLCAVIPWFGGHPDNLKLTIDSTRGICDETIVVHQKLFDEDVEVARSLSDKVECVDWNRASVAGYGDLPNHHGQSNSDWMMLLGTGETIAEEIMPIRSTLAQAPKWMIHLFSHHGDTNRWGRCWAPSSGVHWKAWIHEEAGPVRDGILGPVICRMQDYAKKPHEDEFHNECLKWYKNVSYNQCYLQLLNHQDQLWFCNKGWLGFVRGAAESITNFCTVNADLVEAAKLGNRQAFYDGVRRRMDAELKPTNVNLNPLGQPMTEGSSVEELTA